MIKAATVAGQDGSGVAGTRVDPPMAGRDANDGRVLAEAKVDAAAALQFPAGHMAMQAAHDPASVGMLPDALGAARMPPPRLSAASFVSFVAATPAGSSLIEGDGDGDGIPATPTEELNLGALAGLRGIAQGLAEAALREPQPVLPDDANAMMGGLAQRRAGAIGRSGVTYEPLPLQPSKGSPQPGHLPTAPGSGRGPGSGSASKPGGESIGGAGYGCSKLTSGGGSGTCSDSVHTSRAKLSLASKLLAYSGNPSVSPLGMEFPSRVSSVAVPQLQFAPSTGGRPTCAAGPAVVNSAQKSHMVSGAHAGAAAGQAPAAHQLMVTAAPSNVDGAAAHAGMLPGGAAFAGATAATAATLSVGWDHRTPACQPVKGLLAAAAAKAAAASGAPSSANSTPFDDEMLAALDSLERRVTAATGQADVDAGAGGSATAHGSDQVANPNPSSVGGGPVQTALELLDKQQGRPAQQQEPAWGGFPRLNQPGRPAWQQQDAYPQARSEHQPQHQPQHVQPGHGGSRHEQQGMQPELMGLPQQASHGGAPADLGAGASGGGRTPELPIHTAYAQPQPQGGNASAADVTAQKAGSTGPTPEMESGGLFAALDALEERHRLAEVGAAAVVAAAAAAAAPDGDGQQGQARAASPRLAAAGRADHQQPGAASAGSRRIDGESPLPVKQLAFTPLHVRHAQQQEAQQARPPERPQGYNPYLPPQHPDQGKALANDRPQSEQEQRPAVSGPPQQQLHVSSYGLQAPPVAPLAPEVDNGSSDDDDDAEAYAAALTQRAVVEAGGSQVGSGNLAASLAAVASGAGSAAAVDPGLEQEGPAAGAGAGATPSAQPPPAPPRQLEAYLPEPLCQAYYDRSGRQFDLYEWQAECLCQMGVLMGRNLVYCAPTSGGKSMVAEMLGIRRLLTTGKPFMLVLPFVALCAEKADALQALLAPINRTVNSAYGGQTSGKIIQPGVGAIVATIEKANMLVNAMLEEETLGELSAVIVDELHMVIGMSATMPNVDVVARWLDAALYITDFRPVQLQEYVKVGRRIMDGSGALVRELAPDKGWEDKDTDHVALLTQETVREGHSVLIFCASKFWCEKVAEHVARLVAIAQRDPPPNAAAAAGKDPDGGVSPAAARNARDTYVQELRRLSGGDPTLPDLVARGVAYHHAGLSNEERDLIEAAYKAGAISVLTATSTLAAGVNLPARRVIFRHTYIGKQDNPIDATKYRQMSGRAGRAGIDTAGESFIICEKNRPVAPLLALMQQKANPIASCLTEARKGMKRAVLEVVASGAVSSGTDVKRFIACTLIHAQHGFGAVAKATIAALHWLKDNGFIRVDEATLNWGPTPFGKATLASSMPPEEALVVRADLERARMSLVLATDLHVTYLVTPIKEDLRVDWEIYFHWFEKLSKVDARVAELVPLKEVAEKYGLGKEKGPLEGLQERAGRFSAMVAAFCERLGWSDMEVIIAKFQSRVWYGVRPEVVALTEIPYVKGHRARLLFKAGLRMPEAVAACEFDRLLEILSAGGGAKNPEQEEQQRKTERRAARMILQGAKDLVNQKVQELKQQARALRAALDPRASQEHSAPIDPSLAPPRPPAQEGSDARRPDGAAHSAPAKGGREKDGLENAEARHACAEASAAGPHSDGAAGGARQQPDQAQEQSTTPSRPPKQPRTGRSPPERMQVDTGSNSQGGRLGPRTLPSLADKRKLMSPARQGARVTSPGRTGRSPGRWPGRSPGRGGAAASPRGAGQGGLESAQQHSGAGAAAAGAAPVGGGASAGPNGDESYLHAVQSQVPMLRVPGFTVLKSAGEVAAACEQLRRVGVWAFALDFAEGGTTAAPAGANTNLQLPSVPQVALGRGIATNSVGLPQHFELEPLPAGGCGPAASAGGMPTFALGEAAASVTGRLEGIALCAADGCAVYIPLAATNMPRGKSGKLSLTKGLEERMKMPEVCGSTAHTKALGVLNCAGVVVRQLPTRQADACRRAAMVRRIYIDKLPRLQSEGLLRPLLELEMPLVRILARMEGEGIALAPQVLKDQRGPLEARLRQLAAKAHLAAGMTFDLNSPKDVSEVLFQHLNLPPPPCAFSNQNQRHPSTKKEVLEELEESTHHPIIRLLLDYRTLHKLLTGFVETLYHTAKGQWQRQQHELERCQGQGQQPQRGGAATGGAVKPGGPGPVPDVIRLCGTWLHTSTATGRLAMDEPNLQTVPRPVEYTFMASQLSQASAGTPPAAGADGAELKLLPGEERGGGAGEGGRSVTLHFNLRSAFVAPPGYMVLAADYKQIELRLMAHFSSDAALCALLRNPAQDPFILLAAEWKKVPVEQVTPEVRVQAKRLAYGMLYGMGTNTLAQELGVSVAEAGELSDNFRRAIPSVDRWMREVVEAVRSCGYTTTLMGRRRYYSRINERASKDARSARAQAERQAVNTVCQGSAADLIKAAMVTLQRRLEAEGLAPHVRMVLMVHDELVFEVAEQLLPAAARLVQAVLEGEVALSVPLPVKLSAGPSWGQLRDYEPPPKGAWIQ
eukprot:XP_001701481.1 DNA polymerase theta [Chlamydomonas reinhardtii]